MYPLKKGKFALQAHVGIPEGTYAPISRRAPTPRFSPAARWCAASCRGPLEQGPEALRVPFFHRNTDSDEFIFSHDGDFFSKDNIKPGYTTLHLAASITARTPRHLPTSTKRRRPTNTP